MKKVLLKFGGTRVGDMFHSIPLLKKLKDSNIECDLVHGLYESDAAKLLQYLGLVDKLYSNSFINDGGNLNANAIINFIDHIGNMYDNNYNYDAIIIPEKDNNGSLNGKFISDRNINIDFTDIQWACDIVPDVIVGNYTKKNNYIGVQPSSISGFKTYNELYNVDYPNTVKSFGYSTDKPISNSIEIHGKTLIEVYNELLTCCMVITTHSSIGILSYYLGIPQIFIHFWEHVGTHLSNRKNIISLHKPSLDEIQEEVNKLYNKLNEIII